MTTRSNIIAKLTTTFEPSLLEVIDESEKHRGHAGHRPGGETHFRVRIAARKLEGMSRVAQHRAVNEALAEEFAAGVHALAIEIRPVA